MGSGLTSVTRAGEGVGHTEDPLDGVTCGFRCTSSAARGHPHASSPRVCHRPLMLWEEVERRLGRERRTGGRRVRVPVRHAGRRCCERRGSAATTVRGGWEGEGLGFVCGRGISFIRLAPCVCNSPVSVLQKSTSTFLYL